MTTTISTSRRSSSRSGARASTSTRREPEVICTTRSAGDFHRVETPFAELDARRRALVDLPWTMLDQHHGTTVVGVDRPGGGDGAAGDIAITDVDDTVLGCWAADCAPVVLIGDDREFAVVHAGWRGLAASVIDVAVAAFTEPVRRALLGPAIGPCCYEFGDAELAAVAAGVHSGRGEIAGRTTAGGVALDVPAAVRAACSVHGIDAELLAGCTGCSYDGYSHRVRGDRGRHVVAVWRSSEVTP